MSKVTQLDKHEVMKLLRYAADHNRFTKNEIIESCKISEWYLEHLINTQKLIHRVREPDDDATASIFTDLFTVSKVKIENVQDINSPNFLDKNLPQISL